MRAAAPGLPKQVEIQAGSGVLSALRRAADGEKVAVLLDGAQAAALGTLPFASSLAVVETSPRMPVAVVATVGKRMQEGGWKALAPAFTRLADDPAARDALDGVRMAGFVPLDQASLDAARAAWRRAQ